ncbi:hypothetical protein [Helicobacter sp. MIT 05-5293]|uniref:hypothetical protein n=1 Tax=Helicobacter sp. MIT 05-5293 TaxID=1548149 RepID=UPI000AC367FE|nr:hypothetical protein [Helicobacter sp. MIT 05-5293]
MVFSSYGFIFGFLPIMLFCFYILRHFKQDFLAKLSLILGSFIFYGFWNLAYLPLLFGSILVNFWIGNAILYSHIKLGLMKNLRSIAGGGAK